MYSTLTLTYGIPRDHIYTYMASGSKWAKDFIVEDSGMSTAVPYDLDNDGQDDVTGAANYVTVKNAFTSVLKSKLTDKDRLFVFVTSHGGPDGNIGTWEATFSLFGSERVKDDELRDWTKDLPCPVAFALEPCYSGGFVDDIKSDPDRVIATAANHEESSNGWGSAPDWDSSGSTWACNAWMVQLTAAFRGQYPEPNRSEGGYPWRSYGEADADENEDGRVSFEEAASYAKEHDPTDEHPQYAESTIGLGGRFFFEDAIDDSPVNDNFANATALEGISGSASATNVGATREEDEPWHGYQTVWWTLTPTTDGMVTFSTLSSDYGMTLAVYTGHSLDSLEEVALPAYFFGGLSSFYKVTFAAVAGTTYHIAVGNEWDDNEGNICLSWNTAVQSGDFLYEIRNSEASVFGYVGTATSITVPETLGGYSVTTIDSNAFTDNDTLTEVVLPKTCNNIRAWAFSNCSNLRTVTATFHDENEGENLIYIEDTSFNGCPNLTVRVDCDISVSQSDWYGFAEAVTVKFARSGYDTLQWFSERYGQGEELTISEPEWAYRENAFSYWTVSSLLQVVKPVLSSSSTTFTDSLTVTCSCDTDGATIWYTTDGSTVTEYSSVWPSGGLKLTETTTVRVKAFKDGMDPSEEVVQTYTKEEPKPAVSKFTMDGYQAVVCGVIGATADSFKSTDGFGNTRCLVDSRIVDAEKTSGWNNDTYWCTALSQMDMLVWLGWAQDAGYTDVDDMADYFRSHPEFLCTKPPFDKKEDGPQYGEESYGDVFNWFGEQYEDSELSLEEDDFSRDVLSLALDHGNGLIQIGLVCDCSSKHWADLPAEEITHVVVCCGYVYDGSLPSDDPNSLKGIFIIDPDNDQETNGGARTAPNSISYRPVIWDPECEVYAVAGVWDGRDGYIESSMILYAKPGYTPIGVDVSQSGPLPPLPVEKVQSPVLNPSADTTFELSQRVTCTCPTAGATIRFTTNDTAVAESSPVWVNLTLTTTTVVRVKAFKANMQASDEVKCVYTLNGSPLPKVEAPVLDPPSNVTFKTSLAVRCSCPTEGATIRFATNETDVITETFPVWADLTLTTTTVIRVKAFKANMQASDEVKCVYTLDSEGEEQGKSSLWTAPVIAVGKNDRTEATAATTYTGWLHDSKGNLTALFTMKVGKANKNGIAKVTMTVTDLETGIKSKYTGNYNVEEGEIEGGQLDGLALGEDGVVGKIGKETLTGGRMVNKTEAAAIDGVYKNRIFAFAFQNTAGKNVKGAATFTVKFSGKGKAKISGTLMDGTKVSTSAQLIVGDKGCALPISFSKKGKANFGIVLWFNEKKAGFKEATGLTECTLGDGVTDVKVEFVGCDEVDGSMAKAKALEVDGKKVADIAVNGTKWVATAAKDFETAKPKVTYAAKKGTFTGSYKATVKGAAKPVSAKITGVWLGKTGVGTAVMKVNKVVTAFPVTVK